VSPPFQERAEAGACPRLLHHISTRYRTPEASTLFGAKTAGKTRRNRRKRRPKSVDASGARFYSFTSRKSIHLRFARALRESKKRAAPGISGAARLASRLDSQGCGSQRPTLRRRPRRPTSRAGRCCRGCAGSSCGSPRARTRTGRACRPPRRPRRRSRTAGM